MSVYAKEQSSYLRESLTSMLTQTMAPDQIVVVEDGPLTTQLTATIKGSKNNTLISSPLCLYLRTVVWAQRWHKAFWHVETK